MKTKLPIVSNGTREGLELSSLSLPEKFDSLTGCSASTPALSASHRSESTAPLPWPMEDLLKASSDSIPVMAVGF
nr:hypothetical protein CFP56_70413 [Quercus suber]